jgi:hypothetical protein
MRAVQAAEKLNPEGGGGFNPRIMPAESTRALAPDGLSPSISSKIGGFSAACLAPEAMLDVERNLIRASANSGQQTANSKGISE